MQFFSSFAALGYSAINLVLLWLVVTIVLYRLLGLHKRKWQWAAAFGALMVAGLVASTNFLAQQNRMLNDAIRAEGGLKRTTPQPQTKP